MGYLLSVYSDDLSKVDKATLPIGLQLVLFGEDASEDDGAELINALQELCRTHCQLIGELDHFDYEEEDFPELFEFQWGETSTPIWLPVSEDGIPAMAHWTAGEIPALLAKVEAIDLSSRPAHLSDPITVEPGKLSTPVGELKRWLESARHGGFGLFSFYE